MRVFNFLLLFVLSVVLMSCNKSKNEKKEISIIPVPVNVDIHKGFFELDNETRIFIKDTVFKGVAGFLRSVVAIPTGFDMEISGKESHNNIIKFVKIDNKEIGSEGYLLDVKNDEVVISANTTAGAFYGVQTLLQLLPPEIYSPKKITDVDWQIRSVSIVDYPRFKWRGMHLDVSRHFFPKEFIKKYIDLIAMHKMNVFHWHLTDNNGWRLEIKKYPKLTEISAWRVDREDEPWSERTPPKPEEKATYGGFYTQEDVKEIVNYAAERNIMVIPEIEMPGHTGEVFAAYPELSCSGKKSFVSPGGWPDEDIFCAGNDSVFVFLQNVLDEVFQLFPAPYVHIGGDEADKKTWKKCSKCQKRIKDENLKNEDELQSWFIRKIEKYIVAHGKKLIGWDEILQGGLAPEATVMSWRGEVGGIESAKQGHDAIMCPISHCYFDYYQANPKFEPEAIGGFTTLKKVYSYEPVPEELTTEDTNYILGGQGNVWTEFMKSPEKVEYMAVPRMTALAEVLWSPKDKRNWNDFRLRLEKQFKRFDYLGVNYSKGSWKVNILGGRNKKDGSFLITLETEQLGKPVYYTLDGSDPDTNSLLYLKPFSIDSTVTIKAGIFVDGKLKENYSEKTLYFHKAVGKIAKLKYQPSRKYSGNGAQTLIDGMTGSDYLRDGFWLGFIKNDMDLTIDLEQDTDINTVSVEFMHYTDAWVFAPAKIKVDVLDNNKNIIDEKILIPEINKKYKKAEKGTVIAKFNGVKARYIKVFGERDSYPEWHPGKGKSWMFFDEIIVN